MSKVKGSTKVRVCIDFKSPEDALAWFDLLQGQGAFEKEADLFKQDGIDRTTVGVPVSRTFLIRRVGDRPEAYRLRTKVKKPKE